MTGWRERLTTSYPHSSEELVEVFKQFGSEDEVLAAGRALAAIMKVLGRTVSDDEAIEAALTVEMEANRKLKAAPKCFCGSRCDPPYGDGKQCTTCACRPTGEDMHRIIY